jgi:hypothetical protein
MAGGVPNDPSAQRFRRSDTGRISEARSRDFPRAISLVNGGRSTPSNKKPPLTARFFLFVALYTGIAYLIPIPGIGIRIIQINHLITIDSIHL